MTQLFENNASSFLNGGISPATTGVMVSPGTGDKFPALSNGDYFTATLVGIDGNGKENAWEILKVIARTGDVLTVERGHESTTPMVWASGTPIELRITKAILSDLAEIALIKTLALAGL